MVSPVRFFFEGVPDALRNKRKHQSWIREVIRSEGYEPGSINIIFCNDAFLLELNQSYLNHDTFTDVITFDFTGPTAKNKQIEGEIYISLERVSENAVLFTVPLAEEIKRVIIHGILHLLGYADETARDRLKMKEKEDLYLSLPSIKQ